MKGHRPPNARRVTTGDPIADKCLPAAQRLVAGIHEEDPMVRAAEVYAAFSDARVAVGKQADPATVLAMTLAAMVPYDDFTRVSDLLAWCQTDRRVAG